MLWYTYIILKIKDVVMSKVLVTGGAGFVGKHLLQSLSRHNNIYSIVVDDLSNSKLPDFLLKYGKII